MPRNTDIVSRQYGGRNALPSVGLADNALNLIGIPGREFALKKDLENTEEKLTNEIVKVDTKLTIHVNDDERHLTAEQINKISESINTTTANDIATRIANQSYTALDNQLSRVAKSGSYSDLTNKPFIPSKTSDIDNDNKFQSLEEVQATVNAGISTKQDALVSGENIKTINNQSLLGEGNIEIQGGGFSNLGDLVLNTGDPFTLTDGYYLVNSITLNNSSYAKGANTLIRVLDYSSAWKYILIIAPSSTVPTYQQYFLRYRVSDGEWSSQYSGYSLPTASTSTLGGVKVDGTSITISSGVISANAYTKAEIDDKIGDIASILASINGGE